MQAPALLCVACSTYISSSGSSGRYGASSPPNIVCTLKLLQDQHTQKWQSSECVHLSMPKILTLTTFMIYKVSSMVSTIFTYSTCVRSIYLCILCKN